MSEPSVELWGFRSDDVDGLREELEGRLGVGFQLHESETIGPYYFAPLDDPEAELILRPNLDPDFDEEADDPDDALAEPDFAEFGVLLYVERKAEGAPGDGRLAGLEGLGELLLVE